MRALPRVGAPLALLCAGTFALSSAGTAAQGREVAQKIREEGGYPTDIVPVMPRGEDSAEEAGGDSTYRSDGRSSGFEAPRPVQPVDLSWLKSLLEKILSFFQGGSEGFAKVGLVLGLLLLVLLVVLAFLRFRWVETRRRTEAPSSMKIDPKSRDPLLDSQGEAHEVLAAQGRFREAIHALFIATLAVVVGAGFRDRARTARELVQTAESSKRSILSELLALTEMVWFGGRDATREHYELARSRAQILGVR